jgi:hypothetical protein
MGQEGSLTIKKIGANVIDTSTMGRLTNRMSIDNLLPEGVQGIPGQPKPTRLPAKVRAIEGIDTKFVSAKGQAASTGDGWILPGAAQLTDAEAITNIEQSVELYATMPMDSAQPVIGMAAVVSCEVLADAAFSLETTITCSDTGETITHTHTEAVTAATGMSRVSIPLIPQQYFESAGIEGRNLSVSILRKPNQGSDTANYSSVIIHGVQFENVVHNNQGRPASDALAPFSGNELDTNSNGLNLNSNDKPL